MQDPTHSIAGYNPLVAGYIENIVDYCMLVADHTEGSHRLLHILGPGIRLDCIGFDNPPPDHILLHIAESSVQAGRIVLRVGMNLRQGERKLPVAVAGY